jgi:hypothetical protein
MQGRDEKQMKKNLTRTPEEKMPLEECDYSNRMDVKKNVVE